MVDGTKGDNEDSEENGRPKDVVPAIPHVHFAAHAVGWRYAYMLVQVLCNVEEGKKKQKSKVTH